MGKPLANRRELYSLLHTSIMTPINNTGSYRHVPGRKKGKRKSLYFQRFTWRLKPHITSGNTTVLTLAWDPKGQCWLVSQQTYKAATASWEPIHRALISRAAPLLVSPRGSPPPTSKWRNSLLSVLTSCLAESRAAMAVGFLYSYPRCHNKTERQNIPGHVHCGDRNRELNFPVFLRDYYYFLD